MDQKVLHDRPMKVYDFIMIVGDKIGKVKDVLPVGSLGILPRSVL